MSKSIKELIREEYDKCASNPIYFFKKYCYIQHPKRGKILFDLYPFQEDVMGELNEHRFNVILKSRQLGISTLSAGYSLWLMLFHEDKNVLVIATKQEVAKKIRAGQVVLNRISRGDYPAPFGGFKMSGNGREHGTFGIEEYLEVQAVIT